MHLHVRDDDMMRLVAPHTAKQFGRAIIMPNLAPPVVNTKQAEAYYGRIKDASGGNFEPLMTLYLTDSTSRQDIKDAVAGGVVKACKLYPAGATTNSDNGVTSVDNIAEVIAEMELQDLPLLIHGEVTDNHIDIFDREAVFIEEILTPLVKKHPNLRVVLEHITTRQAVEFVEQAGDNVYATITAHHLLYNRNNILAGGIRPHYYCLPVLKREEHREALIKAATGGSKKFFAGTDSAPHEIGKKESDCGCAGAYTAFSAVEFYASAFDAEIDLSKSNSQEIFENFMSENGADFYGLEYNSESITISKEPLDIPENFESKDGQKLKPLEAGTTLEWKVLE